MPSIPGARCGRFRREPLTTRSPRHGKKPAHGRGPKMDAGRRETIPTVECFFAITRKKPLSFTLIAIVACFSVTGIHVSCLPKCRGFGFGPLRSSGLGSRERTHKCGWFPGDMWLWHARKHKARGRQGAMQGTNPLSHWWVEIYTTKPILNDSGPLCPRLPVVCQAALWPGSYT